MSLATSLHYIGSMFYSVESFANASYYGQPCGLIVPPWWKDFSPAGKSMKTKLSLDRKAREVDMWGFECCDLA